MKVLVVDSDGARRAAVGQALRAGGVEVTEAPSGSFALTMLEWNRHDVILSRSRVDDMDGLELCGILRADPATRELRFVLMADEGESVDTSGVDLVLADGVAGVTVLPMVVQLMRRDPDPPTSGTVPFVVPSASRLAAPALAPEAPVLAPTPAGAAGPPSVGTPPAVASRAITPAAITPRPVITPAPITTPAPIAASPIVTAPSAAVRSSENAAGVPLITPVAPAPIAANPAPVIATPPVTIPAHLADSLRSVATGRTVPWPPVVPAAPVVGAAAPSPTRPPVAPAAPTAAPARSTVAPAAPTLAPSAPAVPAADAAPANPTLRPARAAVDIPARTFQGSLGVMEMEELVQAIAVGHKTGRLLIVVAAGGGMIAFENGRVIHAEFGKRSGTDAFEALVTSAHREGSGKFCFIPGDSTAVANLPRTISASTEQLMLTIAAAMDENKR